MDLGMLSCFGTGHCFGTHRLPRSTFTALVESMVAADYEISAAHLQLSRSIMSQVELSVKETRPTDDVLKQVRTRPYCARNFF